MLEVAGEKVRNGFAPMAVGEETRLVVGRGLLLQVPVPDLARLGFSKHGGCRRLSLFPGD